MFDLFSIVVSRMFTSNRCSMVDSLDKLFLECSLIIQSARSPSTVGFRQDVSTLIEMTTLFVHPPAVDGGLPPRRVDLGRRWGVTHPS